MTVPSTYLPSALVANGLTDTFPFTFKVLAASDLLVEIDGVVFSYPQDYSVTGVGSDSGGSVVLNDMPASGTLVAISRNMPIKRDTDYQNNGDLLADTLDADQDAPILMLQQIQEVQGRTLKVPIGSNLSTVLSSAIAGYFVRVNLAGTGFETVEGTGTAPGQFIQSGVGAVARSYDAKLGEIISVKDFGAVGDGVTDDTLAIQAAIDYAETFSATGGAAVIFPAGKYGYTSLTITANNVVLKGDGEVYLVKTTATGDGLVVGNQAGRVFGVDIRGFQLGSSVTGTAGNLISFINTGQCGVYGLTQTAAFGAPWVGIRVTNASQFTFSDQQWQDCGSDGIVFEDCVDIYIDNSRSDSCDGSGFVFNKVAGVYASNVTAYDNGVHGYSALNTYASPVLTTQNQHWFMSNCIGDTSGNHNWNITQLAQSRFTACWGASHRVATVDLHGIALANCIDVELNNCTATNNNGSGVFILSSCSHIRVTGGGYHGNGVVAGSTHKVGIYSDNAQVTITGATCTDDLRAAIALARVQTHGIRLTGAANGVLIDNCNLAGNLTGPIDVPTTANGLSIRNCYDGNANSYASATIVTVSPLAETIELTGTTDTLDIHPRWKGRKLKIGFTSTARLMDKAGGAAFALPTPAVQPGAFGTASIFFNGTNWLLESFSVNDGV